MNILVLTGPLYPQRGNNANLISKLLPCLAQSHTVRLASPATGGPLPGAVDGFPVHWITDDRRDFCRRFVFPAVGKLTDRDGYSDAVQAMVLARGLREIRKKYLFDAILSTLEPYPAACAALTLPKTVKKVLYLMDPPAAACGRDSTPFRDAALPKILAGHDLVLTTPFIRQALERRGFTARFREAGFPMIEAHPYHPTPSDIPMDPQKINLLFCGWLYSDIRSPRYFLDIAEKLDERFCITFMGKECELLKERFSFETRAEVRAYPQQPYQVALNAMHDADILINIGNSVPVHMPSKTLEYINAGKPMVNFHKMTDCPTLHYTRRYPLCLNLYEGEALNVQIIDQFIRFCADQKGNHASASDLPECTPEYIAGCILAEIGE